MSTTVGHVRKGPYDVYAGRAPGSKGRFGNRYIIGKDGTREDVIAKHRAWALAPEQAAFREDVRRSLRGKRLGCYCAPQACHAETLAWIADSDDDAELLASSS